MCLHTYSSCSDGCKGPLFSVVFRAQIKLEFCGQKLTMNGGILRKDYPDPRTAEV